MEDPVDGPHDNREQKAEDLVGGAPGLPEAPEAAEERGDAHHHPHNDDHGPQRRHRLSLLLLGHGRRGVVFA